MTAPAAEPASPGRRASKASTELVDTMTPARTTPTSMAEKEADARRSIAHRLVLAYIVLLTFSLIIPTAIMLIPHIAQNSITDARDLMLAMSGTLSGLVGILGFVMGYYFKSLDKSPETEAPSTEVTTPRKRARVR